MQIVTLMRQLTPTTDLRCKLALQTPLDLQFVTTYTKLKIDWLVVKLGL